MSSNVCRWGILSTAFIARKNWKAIKNTGNSRLVAVASRDVEKARQFINELQAATPHPSVPEAVGGYDELLKRDDIDAVYIPLPTGVRKEWVIKAAEAGKHVMCEKPCANNAADLREMIDACQRHGVQFMDGVMFMHSARLPSLRKILNDGESVGDLKRITSLFTFRAPEEFTKTNIRASSELECLGCLGDLGWYTIRLTLWTMNYQLPARVSGRLLSQQGRPDSPSPVPMEFSGEMFFRGGVSASFYNSFLTENQQSAFINGTKGYVRLSDFVLPFYGDESSFDVVQSRFEVDGCDFQMRERSRRAVAHEFSNSFADSQETNLFRNFAAIVLSGNLDPHWPEIALKTQKVMDACLMSSRENGLMVDLSE